MDQETKTSWLIFGLAVFITVTAPIWLAWSGIVILYHRIKGDMK